MSNDKRVILCIDDDPDILSFLQIVLEAEGYEFRGAASAEEGAARSTTSRPPGPDDRGPDDGGGRRRHRVRQGVAAARERRRRSSCSARSATTLSADDRTTRRSAWRVCSRSRWPQCKQDFLANMSHEIRTPMTAILGFAELLLENLSDRENLDNAQTIKRNGEHMLRLLNDILDFSKVEAGKLDVERLECSSFTLITDVTSLMRIRADEKGISLRNRFDGPIPETIRTDPTRLRQILINIVGNAIKFTETGSVEIATRLLVDPGDDPKLRFEVIDTGIGIAEDKIETLFLPFTQADSSTTRKFGGTGLGLAISKRLVQLLGGEFSVSSTVGQGSTFSVVIPIGPLDNVRLTGGAAVRVDKEVAAKASGETDAPLLNRRVLLAEDSSDNQRLIGFILKKAGAEVTLADNGQIASDLVAAATSEDSPFDVILMDMQMPVMDGYTATRQLRNDGYSGPIIALTAHAMATDRQKCLDAGCDEYAPKPIDRQKLIAMVAAFLGQPDTVTEQLAGSDA